MANACVDSYRRNELLYVELDDKLFNSTSRHSACANLCQQCY